MRTLKEIEDEIAALRALAESYQDDAEAQASVEAQIDALTWAACFEVE
jgi:hypothetical protein